MRPPPLSVILLLLFLLLCLAAAYFLSDSLQRVDKARQQPPQATEATPAKPANDGEALPPSHAESKLVREPSPIF
ncbi:MAG TPA: hypothetical protein PLT23_10750 [Lentisphaeria bacterium]|nr:hypothetical protein [Lentisphaeria bacterium]